MSEAINLVRKHAVADVDTHIIEPPDLWTSRMPKSLGKAVPHVAYDERMGEERWYIGDRPLAGVGSFAAAGWSEYSPKHPPTLADTDPAGHDAKARLRHMDENGLYYQLLYGNLLGFQAHAFMQELDEPVATACVRAYNDFLTEFASIDPKRIIPIAMLPFWNVEETAREIARVAELGHRGICIAATFENVDLPALGDPHWRPMFRAAADHGLSINFHVGFANNRKKIAQAMQLTERSQFVKESSLFLISNANTVAEVVLSGICEEYPSLDFVSVENGAGWLPYFAETMDWQWLNSGSREEYPNRLLPSEYIRRQVYAMYWFEQGSLRNALNLYPDNIMFETDFPHPTSLSPGPASISPVPAQVIEDSLEGVEPDTIAKVLHDTAARVYRLDEPDPAWVARPQIASADADGSTAGER